MLFDTACDKKCSYNYNESRRIICVITKISVVTGILKFIKL